MSPANKPNTLNLIRIDTCCYITRSVPTAQHLFGPRTQILIFKQCFQLSFYKHCADKTLREINYLKLTLRLSIIFVIMGQLILKRLQTNMSTNNSFLHPKL